MKGPLKNQHFHRKLVFLISDIMCLTLPQDDVFFHILFWAMACFWTRSIVWSEKNNNKKRIQTIQNIQNRVISCHFYGVSPCSLRLNQVQASKRLSLDKRTDASERPINQHHYHIIFSIGHNMPIAGAVTCGNLWNSTMNIWKKEGKTKSHDWWLESFRLISVRKFQQKTCFHNSL